MANNAKPGERAVNTQEKEEEWVEGAAPIPESGTRAKQPRWDIIVPVAMFIVIALGFIAACIFESIGIFVLVCCVVFYLRIRLETLDENELP